MLSGKILSVFSHAVFPLGFISSASPSCQVKSCQSVFRWFHTEFSVFETVVVCMHAFVYWLLLSWGSDGYFCLFLQGVSSLRIKQIAEVEILERSTRKMG